MNRMKKIFCEFLFHVEIVGLLFLLLGGCSRSTQSEALSEPSLPAQPSSPTPEKDAPEIKRLIDKAYDFKYEGKNGEALALFNEIQKKIIAVHGKNSEAYASNLDDLGTCYFRGGDYKKARALYEEAARILESLSLTNERLFAAVRRRLRTLAAFEKINYVCAEPLISAETATQGADTNPSDALPYFPSSEDLYKVYYKMNKELKGCVGKIAKAVPVWNVITGDGRVLLSEVKSDDVSAKEAACIEKTLLLDIVPKYNDALPRFRACYRNYTFPLVFRD